MSEEVYYRRVPLKKMPGDRVVYVTIPKNVEIVNKKSFLFKIEPGIVGSGKVYRVLEVKNGRISKIEPDPTVSLSLDRKDLNSPIQSADRFYYSLLLSLASELEFTNYISSRYASISLFSGDGERFLELYLVLPYFEAEVESNKVLVFIGKKRVVIAKLYDEIDVTSIVQSLAHIRGLEPRLEFRDGKVVVSLKIKNIEGTPSGILATTEVIRKFDEILDKYINKYLNESTETIIKNVIKEMKLREDSLVEYVALKTYVVKNPEIIECIKRIAEELKYKEIFEEVQKGIINLFKTMGVLAIINEIM